MGGVESEASAQAALMLVESLMLALIDAGVLNAETMVEAVETVIDTKRQMAADGIRPEVETKAAGMLSSLAASLAAASTDRSKSKGL